MPFYPKGTPEELHDPKDPDGGAWIPAHQEENMRRILGPVFEWLEVLEEGRRLKDA